MKKRVIYLDLLRMLSIFMMMMLHTSSSFIAHSTINDMQYSVFNIYLSMTRFCVPMFIMISGVFFLNNDNPLDIKTLYKKNIIRLITAFLFWSTLYVFFRYIQNPTDIKNLISNIITGHYHLWFIYTLSCYHLYFATL